MKKIYIIGMDKLKAWLKAYLRSCVSALKRFGKDLWNACIFLVGLGISVVPSIAAGVWFISSSSRGRLPTLLDPLFMKVYFFLLIALMVFSLFWNLYWFIGEKITKKKSRYRYI